MIVDLTGSQREIVLSLGINDAHSVLDIGCGNGEKTFFIAQHVQRLVGIDPDEKLIKAAQTNFVRKNLFFLVGQGESLNFQSSSFSSVLFNESFHHISIEKQIEALRETWRILEPEGKVLITEPIYGKGSFEEILRFYNDEEESRRCAIEAIESLANKKFTKALKKEIRIEYSCEGFEDLYKNNIKTKPYANWNDADKHKIIDVLKRCDKTSEGDFIIDYFATVWLLYKKG